MQVLHYTVDILLFFSPEMGESAQLSFAPKISGEFLSIWAKFPQNSKWVCFLKQCACFLLAYFIRIAKRYNFVEDFFSFRALFRRENSI
jgi:hypothetical protein